MARAISATRVALTGTAGSSAGILCLGRPAAGETYTHGEFVQRSKSGAMARAVVERQCLAAGRQCCTRPGPGRKERGATMVALAARQVALPALRELLTQSRTRVSFL